MSAAQETRVAVVGAGIAGLAAALELESRGVPFRLLEAREVPGGTLRTESREGYRFECGPNAFLVKAPALGFLRRHRLGALVVRAGPEARERFLFRDGSLHAVPSSPVAALRTPLLSSAGKLRALREPFVGRGDASAESVAAFVRRRLGDEVLEKLVSPFLVGVYAGDVEQLGVEAVFPSLVEYERARGSIVRGALRGAFRAPPGGRGLPGSYSAVGGLGGLAAGIADRLGPALVCGTAVTAIEPKGEGWCLHRETGGTLEAEAVLLAVPAIAAAALLRPLDEEAAELLDGIEYAPMVSVALGIDPARATFAPRGFGFLVPESEEIELLGTLFMSRIFPGRAPAGRELLTCMIGGRRWPEAVAATDEEILARVGRGLEATLGLAELPDPLAVTRWPRAVPQPGVDHPRRVLRLRELVARRPGLALAGAYLDAVSVADAMASGVRAADHLAGQLS